MRSQPATLSWAPNNKKYISSALTKMKLSEWATYSDLTEELSSPKIVMGHLWYLRQPAFWSFLSAFAAQQSHGTRYSYPTDKSIGWKILPRHGVLLQNQELLLELFCLVVWSNRKNMLFQRILAVVKRTTAMFKISNINVFGISVILFTNTCSNPNLFKLPDMLGISLWNHCTGATVRTCNTTAAEKKTPWKLRSNPTTAIQFLVRHLVP